MGGFVEHEGGGGLSAVNAAGEVDGALVGGEAGGGEGEDAGLHGDADVGFGELEAFDEDAVVAEGGGVDVEVLQGGEAGGVGEGAGDVEGHGAGAGEDGAGGEVFSENLLRAGEVIGDGEGQVVVAMAPREDGAGVEGNGVAEAGGGVFFGDAGVGGDGEQFFGSVGLAGEVEGGGGVRDGAEEVGKFFFEVGDVHRGGNRERFFRGGGRRRGLEGAVDFGGEGLGGEGELLEVDGVAVEGGLEGGFDLIALEGVAVEGGAGGGEL